jgi:predicted nuclease with TOPRIM domain
MQGEQPRQRELKNVSYNYLVEACFDRNKSKIVLDMMEETLQDEPDSIEDVYTNSDLEEKTIQGIMLNKTGSLTNKLRESYHRSPTLTKKIIIENFGAIVKGESVRREVTRY